MKQAVTVVVATGSLERWPSLVRAVASARSQTVMPAEVVVVVDHDEQLFRRVRRDLAGITVLRSAERPGLPGARNTGAFHAQTSLIAFLDDDSVADPGWLGRVIAPLSDRTTVGAGAQLTPEWETGRPRWLPSSSWWAAGPENRGNPSGTVVRREEFRQAGGFAAGDDDFGSRLSGVSGGRFAYVGAGLIRHLAPARLTFASYLRRCYAQGRGHQHPAVDRRTGSAARPGVVVTGRAVLRDLRAGQMLRAGGLLAGATALALGAATRSLRAGRPAQRVLAPAR
ncbi:hypothetical protein GCM10010172_08530 [Paractinoplanes ferrugineus]|uniref:Glycosyltransferase 2-like domain-containing protein n=1 Tax=Paractinoplanes ferrugineus TaxID=113564 RepID=A0A919J5T7_9ACTN|nr:glycosyltransferase [Actinoplanes ferrugineus]GIE15386.1 hypothetical protein Afe05nite_72260 [Actinoplanes ferrugineus]